MIKIVCDYCNEPNPRHYITMTRRPNDEELVAEICDQCLSDVMVYIEESRTPLD